MIALDTSGLMAIVLSEPEADACIAALEAESEVMVSAGTVAEARIVSGRRNVGAEMARLVEEMGFEIVPVSPAAALLVAQCCDRWGKGAPGRAQFRRLLRLRGGQAARVLAALCRGGFRAGRHYESIAKAASPRAAYYAT